MRSREYLYDPVIKPVLIRRRINFFTDTGSEIDKSATE